MTFKKGWKSSFLPRRVMMASDVNSRAKTVIMTDCLIGFFS